VATDHVAPDLRGGEPAVVVVRPEATRIEPATAATGEGRINRIPARLADLVAIGPSLRLRAATPQGQEFEALMRRADHPATHFNPGDEVFVTFDAAATRVYRPDNAPSQ
jgi:hypothetical protein